MAEPNNGFDRSDLIELLGPLATRLKELASSSRLSTSTFGRSILEMGDPSEEPEPDDGTVIVDIEGLTRPGPAPSPTGEEEPNERLGPPRKEKTPSKTYDDVLAHLVGLYNGEEVFLNDAARRQRESERRLDELAKENAARFDVDPINVTVTSPPQKEKYDPTKRPYSEEEVDSWIEEEAKNLFPKLWEPKTFDIYLDSFRDGLDVSTDEKKALRNKRRTDLMEQYQRVAKSYIAGRLSEVIDDSPRLNEHGHLDEIGLSGTVDSSTKRSDVGVLQDLGLIDASEQARIFNENRDEKTSNKMLVEGVVAPYRKSSRLPDIDAFQSQQEQFGRSFPHSITSERRQEDIISAIVTSDPSNARLFNALKLGRGNTDVIIDGITITAFEQTQFAQAVFDPENLERIYNGTLAQSSGKGNYQDAVGTFLQTDPENVVYSFRKFNDRMQAQDRKQYWSDQLVDQFKTPAGRLKAIKKQMGLSIENGGLGLNELAYTTKGDTGKYERAIEEINRIALEIEDLLWNHEMQLIGSNQYDVDQVANLLAKQFIDMTTDPDFAADVTSRVNAARADDERKLSEDRRSTRIKAAQDNPLSLFVEAGVKLQDAPEGFLAFLEEEAIKELRRASLGQDPFEPSQVVGKMIREQPQLYGSRGAARFDFEGPGPTPTRDEMSELFSFTQDQGPSSVRSQTRGRAARQGAGLYGDQPQVPRHEPGLYGTWSSLPGGSRQSPYQYEGTMPPGIGQDVPGPRGRVPIAGPDIFQPFGVEIDPTQAARQGRGILPVEEVISAVKSVAGDDPDLFNFLLSSDDKGGGRLPILLKEFEKAQQADIDARIQKAIYGHDAIVEPGQQYVEDSEGNLVAAPETGIKYTRDSEGNLVPVTGTVEETFKGGPPAKPGQGGLSEELFQLINKQAGTLVEDPFAKTILPPHDPKDPKTAVDLDPKVIQPKVTKDQFVNIAKQEVLAQSNIEFLDFLKEQKGKEKQLLASTRPPKKKRSQAGRNILVRSI